MRILFISLAAPPKASPESFQVSKYLYSLGTLHKVHLWTVKHVRGGWEIIDPSLEKYLSTVNEISYLNSFSSRYLRFIIRTFSPKFLKRPDEYFLIQIQWKKVIRNLKETPQLIYSRASPISSNLLALKIKKKIDVPWVMHLSDLWADSPIMNFTGKTFEYHQRLEAECFNKADRISFTSYETQKFYSDKYPNLVDKFFLSFNVYDDEELGKLNPFDFKKPIKFLHAGNFYGPGRNPLTFLRAVGELIKENPIYNNELTIQLYGRMNPDVKEAVNNLHLSCLDISENQTFDESRENQRNGHIMLLFDWKIDNMKSPFFLSKILGYMVSRKTILAITEKGSACYNVIEGKYGKCFEHEDVAGVKSYIKQIIDNFEVKNHSFFETDKPDPRYSTAYNVDVLNQVFRDLTSK